MNIKLLNDERKRQKISIKELAIRAKLPKATVEKILFGIVKNPRIDTMYAIEKALGLNGITDEEYKQGIRLTKSVQITADQEDILDKYKEVEERLGENGKELIINFCDILLGKRKK